MSEVESDSPSRPPPVAHTGPITVKSPPQVAYVRPEAPPFMPAVTAPGIGASVSIISSTGLRSRPLRSFGHGPAARDSIHFYLRIPPTVATAAPKISRAAASGSPGVGALKTPAPFAQSHGNKPNRVVPIAEFGGNPVDLEVFIRDIPALDSSLLLRIT